MRFIIIIFVLLFGKSVVANSFYKIYDNEKYDNFRGIAFNDFVLAIATNDSVIFGVVNDEFGFDKIGSKQLTTFVSGENELLEFKFIQKYIVIVCNKYDCCYCKIYGNENDCIAFNEVKIDNHLLYDSINVHQETDILFVRYVIAKNMPYFDTYQYVNDRYHMINTTSDRLTLKGEFSSLYSFTRGSHIYFVTQFKKTISLQCLFPDEAVTRIDEIHFMLTKLCNNDSTNGIMSRMDLILSCSNIYIAGPSTKLESRGVLYHKTDDSLLFTLGDAMDDLTLCNFKMKGIDESFCNTWNYCTEESNKTLSKFSEGCEVDAQRYGKRCYKKKTSTDYCNSPYSKLNYLSNSCQMSHIMNNSFLSMENPINIKGSDIFTEKMIESTIDVIVLQLKSYGMMMIDQEIYYLRKIQEPSFEPVMLYQNKDYISVFDIDSEKFCAPWDSKKGVLYIDPKVKNSIYFKTISCLNGTCKVFLSNSPIKCTHTICTDIDECSIEQKQIFCGPLWFDARSYVSERNFSNGNGSEEITCVPKSNLIGTNCSYKLPEKHKKFLMAPLSYSKPTSSINYYSLIIVMVLFTTISVSMTFACLFQSNKQPKKSTNHTDQSYIPLVNIENSHAAAEVLVNQTSPDVEHESNLSDIQTNDQNTVATTSEAIEVPVVPALEYGIVDQDGEIDPNKLVKAEILGQGNFGYVRLEYLISNNKAIKVAVKYLHKQYNEDELIREINSIKSCKHTNIVKFIGWVRNDDGMGIVTEFMEGGDLHNYLINPKKEIRVSQIFSYITQIVDAMVYLHHEMKILHRDIAARNCLLNTAYTVVKVNDFGLARVMDKYYQYYSKNKHDMALRWAPLEMLDNVNQKKFTSKADIWSFGVLMWEMFEKGAVPYNGMNIKTFKRFLQSGGRLQRPQDCPEELYAVMEQCWHDSPVMRPTFKSLQTQITDVINNLGFKEFANLNVTTQFQTDNLNEPAAVDTGENSKKSALINVVNDVEDHELLVNEQALSVPLCLNKNS